jgi:hypothetical protein
VEQQITFAELLSKQHFKNKTNLVSSIRPQKLKPVPLKKITEIKEK